MLPPYPFHKVTHSRGGPLLTLRHCTTNSPLLSSGPALTRRALSSSTSAAVTPFRLAPGFLRWLNVKPTVATASAARSGPTWLRARVCACVRITTPATAHTGATSLTSTSTSRRRPALIVTRQAPRFLEARSRGLSHSRVAHGLLAIRARDQSEYVANEIRC